MTLFTHREVTGATYEGNQNYCTLRFFNSQNTQTFPTMFIWQQCGSPEHPNLKGFICLTYIVVECAVVEVSVKIYFAVFRYTSVGYVLYKLIFVFQSAVDL